MVRMSSTMITIKMHNNSTCDGQYMELILYLNDNSDTSIANERYVQGMDDDIINLTRTNEVRKLSSATMQNKLIKQFKILF